MSFTLGNFYLAPGETMDYWVTLNGGQDCGAQWIMAHPILGNPPSVLQVSNFRMELDYSIGSSTLDTQNLDSAFYRYLVTVENIGLYGVNFNLTGGGNI